MIKVENLTVQYRRDSVLKDLNFRVSPGEFVLITGPSGCGKSTLARVISGLIPHAVPARVQGEVVVDGRCLLDRSLPDAARSVGMVFQNPASQLFHLSVREELAFGPRNLGLNDEDVKQRVAFALRAVGIEQLALERPDQLSGGQKQLVAIAAVLAMRPRVLVLDEPTASLDSKSTEQVIAALTRMNQEQGITIVLIEHRLQGALQSVDRVYLMDRGEIIVEGGLEEVFSDSKRRKEFGLRRLGDQGLASWNDLIEKNGSSTSGEQPVLEFNQVSAGYQGKPVIRDINFKIYPGEFTALVGENGTGKSTLALTAAGLIKPSSGEVIFQGGKKPKPGLDVALLFQNPQEQLFSNTVREEISFAPENFGQLDLEDQKLLLQKTGLDLLQDRLPATLSIGQQLRTALAASISIHPRLVILDEPTLGQDWGHLSSLMSYLEEINQEGTAIILISHDYKLVHRYARKVMLLEKGQITFQGKIKQ